MAKKTSLSKTFFPTALVLSLLALVLASCGGASGQESARQRQQAPQPYPVLSVQPRSIVLTSTYPATLEGEQTVEIRPRVQGYITEMRVDEGDPVDRNQVLFRLNSEEYQQAVRSAQADVEAAQANVQQARDEVERISALVEKDIISDYELKDARNTLQTRKAALNQAQAALTNAQVNLSYTNVRSPASGVIGEINYRIGSLVSSSITEPLTVVSDVSQVYAYFSMSERELLGMSQQAGREGAQAQQQVRALRGRIEDLPKVNLILADSSTYPIEGDVKLASGLIDTGTGSASFRALFPNPNRVLRSGATANVQIPFSSEGSIVIPKSATYEIQNKRFVYRVADSNAVESVEVQTAPISTDKLFVLDRGLDRGDQIVTEGMTSLQDGTKIKPQPVDADSLYQALTTQDQSRLAQAGGSQWKQRQQQRE